ncbi:hypothetical protein ADN00_00130 [Ornatilinea apprima]|uniref:Iron-binding zinc finger CDGSH type domain-containing protein n=1 Tax=Ornatilinea apprima TaxID=1134406 RepID=A0A0P6Y6D9_9CHLR|nr:CDGSH iron-sulfur domain-containing protein [Ornatilinea apprima]KPL80998.1 hypothetical protein ADN00_00130 [Ornatilinea apprima]
MAEHSTEEKNGYLKTWVTLHPGEKVSLCRCFKSKKFPLCDGTHKLEGTHGPVSIQVTPCEEDKKQTD